MGNSCLEYEVLTLDIPFPKDHVRCSICPVLETYARRQCRSTGEYLLEGQLIGARCPLRGQPNVSFDT